MKRFLPVLFAMLVACGDDRRSPDDAGMDLDQSDGGSADGSDGAEQTFENIACRLNECSELAQTVDVVGSSPLGELTIEKVGVIYLIGLTQRTVLVLEGTRAGNPVRIDVFASANDHVDEYDYAVKPGRYRGTFGAVRVQDSEQPEACDLSSLEDVELVIEEHVFPTGEEVNRSMTTKLRGRLIMHDPDWDLEVPFDIGPICDWHTSR